MKNKFSPLFYNSGGGMYEGRWCSFFTNHLKLGIKQNVRSICNHLDNILIRG